MVPPSRSMCCDSEPDKNNGTDYEANDDAHGESQLANEDFMMAFGHSIDLNDIVRVRH
jgi:hypothetical protein